jgi:hypothetical protein
VYMQCSWAQCRVFCLYCILQNYAIAAKGMCSFRIQIQSNPLLIFLYPAGGVQSRLFSLLSILQNYTLAGKVSCSFRIQIQLNSFLMQHLSFLLFIRVGKVNSPAERRNGRLNLSCKAHGYDEPF